MRKIKLSKEKDTTNIFDVSNVTVEIESGHLPAVLTGMVDFLLAIGYGEETINKYLNVDQLAHDIGEFNEGRALS